MDYQGERNLSRNNNNNLSLIRIIVLFISIELNSLIFSTQFILIAGSANPSMQLLYEASLCLWQLTFLQEAADEISCSQEIITHLVEIARTAQKEKVRFTIQNPHQPLCKDQKKEELYKGIELSSMLLKPSNKE